MPSDFSKMLSRLRHDKQLSQRRVAEELGVSQALLSHYENGIREPRLDFVIRACAYYGVSSDYMLGLSTVRTNPLLASIDKPDTAYNESSLLHANDEMHRLVSSVVLLFGLLADIGDDELVSAGSLYLGTALYKMLRDLLPFDTDVDATIFRMPSPAYIPLGDAVLMVSEMVYREKARQNIAAEKMICNLSEECLQSRFPSLYNSLLELIRTTETNIAKYLDRS